MVWISFLLHWVVLWCWYLLYIVPWHSSWAVCERMASPEVWLGWGDWSVARRLWCILTCIYAPGDSGGPNLGWCQHKVFPPSRLWLCNLLGEQKSGVVSFLFQRILLQSCRKEGWIGWVSICVSKVLGLSWFGCISVLLIVFRVVSLRWVLIGVGRVCLFGYPRIHCRLVLPSCVYGTVYDLSGVLHIFSLRYP